MKNTITLDGGEPVIRTHFYFSDYELALVTMTDLKNNVVTYTSTGGISGVECKSYRTSLTEFFARESIPITKDAMLDQHEKVLQSKDFTSFIEKLKSEDLANDQSE